MQRLASVKPSVSPSLGHDERRAAGVYPWIIFYLDRISQKYLQLTVLTTSYTLINNHYLNDVRVPVTRTLHQPGISISPVSSEVLN